MNKREVVKLAVGGRQIPYVPWACSIGRMTILKKILFTALACVLFGATGNLWGGDVIQSRPAKRAVEVDEQGVIRWRDTGEEVALFGVNYCVPSGYTYRAIGYVGASRQQPYWEKPPTGRGGDGDRLNTQELAGLQVSLGKRLFKNEADGPHGIEIESILLENSNPRE